MGITVTKPEKTRSQTPAENKYTIREPGPPGQQDGAQGAASSPPGLYPNQLYLSQEQANEVDRDFSIFQIFYCITMIRATLKFENVGCPVDSTQLATAPTVVIL